MKQIIFYLLVSIVTISCRQNKEIIALQKQAEQGNAKAQYNLGMSYRIGNRIE